MAKKVVGFALLLLTLEFFPFPPLAMGSLATVSIQPFISKVWGTDETFTINITVTDVTNLYGWEIKLYFENWILNCTGASEGPFLKTAGSTFFNNTIENNYNSTHGRVKAFCTLLGEIPGVNGTGVLLSVAFKTFRLGITILDITESVLADINGNTMPHTAVDGAVEVVEPIHDVAIKNVTVASNIIVSGQTLELNVTASNAGNKTETFYVAAYANETLIANQTVSSLPPGADILLVFLWSTAPITPNATLIIRAEASQVFGETNLENNLFIYGVIYVIKGLHDIAVTNVRPATQQVYEGEKVDIYVTVANLGNYTETFNVTLYIDEVFVDIQTVQNLLYGASRELVFSWDARGKANKTYTINAVATIVAGETNIANNNMTSTITVYSRELLSIKIVEVVPCNMLGQPVSSFLVGTVANFKVTLNCSMIGAKTILLTISVFDARENTIGVVSFQGPVASGTTTFILGLPIPTTARTGIAKVCANALSDWPHLGGSAYCPEVSATFEIRR